MSEKKFHILFVCSGNSCRSPMAEGLLKIKLPPELKDKVEIQSAGTLGIYGSPATDFAIMVAQEKGADISQHRSRGLDEEIISKANIIFCMAPEHKEFIARRFPEVLDNVFLLTAFDRKPNENYPVAIEDPIGGSLEVYRKCIDLIDSELNRILPRLVKLIKDKLKDDP